MDDQGGYDPTAGIIQALMMRQQSMGAQPQGNGGMVGGAANMANQLLNAYVMKNMMGKRQNGLFGGANSYTGPFSPAAAAQPANSYTGNMY